MLERAVPALGARLHASLMARLDRVPGVKEVAQVAACIGREFASSPLAASPAVPSRPARRPRPARGGRACLRRAASRRRRATRSSMRWCAMPPTTACSSRSASGCMPA